MLTYHVYRPEEGMTEGGKALARMLANESPGKSYADVMRARAFPPSVMPSSGR